jgi:hypothetical protein
LFTVVATAFIGSWLTPSIIKWRSAKKQRNKLSHFHNEIKNLYNDGKLNRNEIVKLDKLSIDIKDAYAQGEIANEQFKNLSDDVSLGYREIFNKELNSLMDVSEKDIDKLLDEIKNNLDDSYAQGKLTKLHYNLLIDKLNLLLQKSKNKII